jgi:hypothetical protein
MVIYWWPEQTRQAGECNTKRSTVSGLLRCRGMPKSSTHQIQSNTTSNNQERP